jgi:hypothetical protein
MRSLLFILTIATVALTAGTTNANAATPQHYLKTVYEDGRPSPGAAGLVKLQDNGGKPFDARINLPLPDGTQIEAPAHIGVVIARSDNKAFITLNPGSRLTIVATTDMNESTAQGSGKISFDVVPHALDFFRVAFKRFNAAVRGTVFSVDASNPTSVAFDCTRGTVDVVQSGSVYLSSQFKTVAGVQTVAQISATGRRSVTYSLDETQYLQKFKTLKDAASYFNARLTEAEKNNDPVEIDAARASLFALYRTLGETDKANAVAGQRLAFVLAHRAKLSDRSLAEAYLQTGYWSHGGAVANLANVLRSIAIWKRIDAAGTQSGHAVALRRYGELLMDAGSVGDALSAYESDVTIAQAAGDNLEAATGIGDIGVLDERLHNSEDELVQYQRALAFSVRAQHSDVWPDVAWLYGNLSIAAQNASDIPLEIQYAKQAVDRWHQIIGDDTNDRYLSSLSRYISTLTYAGSLNESLAVANVNITSLRRAHHMKALTARDLLNDRAYIYEQLRRNKDARADRAEALAIDKLHPSVPSTDPVDKLDAASRAADVKHDYVHAAQLSRQRLELIKREPHVSPLRVAEAEAYMAYDYEHAGHLKDGVAARRRGIADIARLGALARRRLADAYSDLAVVEYDRHDFAGADADANSALKIANESPRLVRQAATALRALASSARSSQRFHEESVARSPIIDLDQQQHPVDPVQLASDEGLLADAIFADVHDNDQRVAHYTAARNALVNGHVPQQNEAWASNNSDLGDAYYWSGEHQKALEHHLAAYNSLAQRRPLMNDYSLAYYARSASIDYDELAHHNDKRRTEYLNDAHTEAQKAIRILANLGTEGDPMSRFYAYDHLTAADMMRGERAELTNTISNSMRQLDVARALGFNHPDVSYHNVLGAYLSVAEDEELTAHSYLKEDPGAEPLLAWFILVRAAPILAVPHTRDTNDVYYYYYLSILRQDLGAVSDADLARRKATSLAAHLNDQQLKQLLSSIGGSEGHGQAWGDRSLRRKWLVVETEINRELMKSAASSTAARLRLIADYTSISDNDIYMRNPEDAIADAKIGLALDASNQSLLMNLAHGYLFSGDIKAAKAIYLAHQNEPHNGKKFSDAVIKDFADYRAAGVEDAATAEIEASMAAATP